MKIAAALMLTSLAFVRAASAQDCKSDDFSSFSNVKNSVQSWMASPKGMIVLDSFREKAIQRSGDSAAVAIAKVVSDADLQSPTTMTRVLFILRMAFSAHQIIEVCSDRDPRMTMILLEYLRHFQEGRFEAEIEKAKSLILEGSSAVVSPIPQ
jgi:hypothetical protein